MIREIETRVWQIPLIDTHKHLFEEHERLSANPQLAMDLTKICERNLEI